MICTATCPHCVKSFQFDPTRAPAQRIRANWRAPRGRVVGYYPVCPHCGRTVELGNPPAATPPLQPGGERSGP